MPREQVNLVLEFVVVMLVPEHIGDATQGLQPATGIAVGIRRLRIGRQEFSDDLAHL